MQSRCLQRASIGFCRNFETLFRVVEKVDVSGVARPAGKLAIEVSLRG